MELQKTTGFLKNAYYQGHGRYVNQIARLTIKFCKTSASSREARRFIETKLVDVARENPGCVIYVKPRFYKSPVLVAEYLNGEKHSIMGSRMGAAHLGAWISWLLTRSGQELYKLERPITTYRPSIQGIWTPFYFRDPKWNLTEFPSDEAGKHISGRPTASEQLIELAKKIGQAK